MLRSNLCEGCVLCCAVPCLFGTSIPSGVQKPPLRHISCAGLCCLFLSAQLSLSTFRDAASSSVLAAFLGAAPRCSRTALCGRLYSGCSLLLYTDTVRRQRRRRQGLSAVFQLHASRVRMLALCKLQRVQRQVQLPSRFWR